jgi:hypothetical protein
MRREWPVLTSGAGPVYLERPVTTDDILRPRAEATG